MRTFTESVYDDPIVGMLVDTFQKNNWNDARSVLLVFTEAGKLFDRIFADAVALRTLWNSGMGFELLGAYLKRDVGMGKKVVVPVRVGMCAMF